MFLRIGNHLRHLGDVKLHQTPGEKMYRQKKSIQKRERGIARNRGCREKKKKNTHKRETDREREGEKECVCVREN